MILPSDSAKRGVDRKRQAGLPGQFTTPEKEDVTPTAGETRTTTKAKETDHDEDKELTRATGQRESTTGQREATSTPKPSSTDTARMTSIAGHSDTVTNTISSGLRTISSQNTTSVGSSTSTSVGATAVLHQSQSLIYLTTFAPNFPIPTHKTALYNTGARGYVFVENAQLVDSMLLFFTFIGALAFFSALLIRISRCLERHRGVTREDGMVSDDMRWAEGREVVEKRIVWDGTGIVAGHGGVLEHGGGYGGMGRGSRCRVGDRGTGRS